MPINNPEKKAFCKIHNVNCFNHMPAPSNESFSRNGHTKRLAHPEKYYQIHFYSRGSE